MLRIASPRETASVDAAPYWLRPDMAAPSFLSDSSCFSSIFPEIYTWCFSEIYSNWNPHVYFDSSGMNSSSTTSPFLLLSNSRRIIIVDDSSLVKVEFVTKSVGRILKIVRSGIFCSKKVYSNREPSAKFVKSMIKAAPAFTKYLASKLWLIVNLYLRCDGHTHFLSRLLKILGVMQHWVIFSICSGKTSPWVQL